MSGFRRVVLDTSTLVSAALRVGSVPHQAFSRAAAQGELCFSQHTLAELDTVLMRPKFDKYLPPDLRREFLGLVHELAVLVPVVRKMGQA